MARSRRSGCLELPIDGIRNFTNVILRYYVT